MMTRPSRVKSLYTGHTYFIAFEIERAVFIDIASDIIIIFIFVSVFGWHLYIQVMGDRASSFFSEPERARILYQWDEPIIGLNSLTGLVGVHYNYCYLSSSMPHASAA